MSILQCSDVVYSRISELRHKEVLLPRKPRHYLPGVPAHVIQRGNNRRVCLLDQADYRTYLDYLGEAALRLGCRIHAHVLMTNHVHLN